VLKALFILATIALSATSLAAQTYQVDNFDFPNAVKIQSPRIEPSKSKRLVHLTSQIINPSLGGFTTGNSDVDNYIVESGKRNSVDPLLLYSIMHQESSFKARACRTKARAG
jgi:soluble lytic murein transglycosylase-like protein